MCYYEFYISVNVLLEPSACWGMQITISPIVLSAHVIYCTRLPYIKHKRKMHVMYSRTTFTITTLMMELRCNNMRFNIQRAVLP